MKTTQVKSSQIKEYTYNSDTHELDVTFHNGGTYRYHGVKPDAHEAFSSADSFGKHLNQRIKPNHRCEKLTGSNGK